MRDKLPPQELNIERTVLGTIIINSEAASIVFEMLDEETFYHGANKRIFKSLKDMYVNNIPIELITLSVELKNRGWLEQIGGESYLAELAESIATVDNIKHYADILLDKAKRRAAIIAAMEIQNEAYNEETPCVEIALKSEQKIIAAFDDKSKKDIKLSSDVMSEVGTEMDRIISGGRIGITTGFKNLDETISGLEGGDFIVLAGRPRMGKSALLLCMALRQAMIHHIPVAIFSLEMPTRALGQRLLSIESGIPLYRIRHGKIYDGEMKKITEAEARIAEAPIYFDDVSNMTTMELKSRLMRLKRKYHIGVAYVDYLQLIHSMSDDPVYGTTLISGQLKNIGKEFNIPLIALSQLSRLSAKRGKDHRPRLEDLRQSGALEQDADVVIFVNREHVYSEKDEDKFDADIIVAKQRQGPTGDVKMRWVAENTCFTEPEVLV